MISKQVSFPLTHMEGFTKFCELANLSITEKYVSATMQDAYVDVFVSAGDSDVLDKAFDCCLVYGKYIITLLGIYRNNSNGVSDLLKDLDTYRSAEISLVLTSISELATSNS